MLPRKFLTEEGCFLERFWPLKIENFGLEMAFSCVLETPDLKFSLWSQPRWRLLESHDMYYFHKKCPTVKIFLILNAGLHFRGMGIVFIFVPPLAEVRKVK